MPEFQCVLLAGGHGTNLRPLSYDIPKPMLPLLMVPMIHYQLKMLENAGCEEIIIVTIKEYEQKIIEYISQAGFGQYAASVTSSLTPTANKIQVKCVESGIGTADALREIKSYLKNDFFVIPCDLVTDCDFHSYMDMFKIKRASIMMLLKGPEPVKGEVVVDHKVALKALATADLIGLNDKNRVIYVAAVADLTNHEVKLPKPLLKQESNFAIHSNLQDLHFYIFSHWVLELLDDKSITSIKDHLVPLVVKFQFKREIDLPSESCIVSASGPLHDSMLFSANEEGRQSVRDPVRVFAMVKYEGVCLRVNSLAKYASLNIQMITSTPSLTACWKKSLISTSKFTKLCVTGRDGSIGDKSSLISSVLGKHHRIGANTKITNCVILDNVSIGSNCILEGCVLSNEVTIEDGCKMKDCTIGKSITIHSGSVLDKVEKSKKVFA